MHSLTVRPKYPSRRILSCSRTAAAVDSSCAASAEPMRSVTWLSITARGWRCWAGRHRPVTCVRGTLGWAGQRSNCPAAAISLPITPVFASWPTLTNFLTWPAAPWACVVPVFPKTGWPGGRILWWGWRALLMDSCFGAPLTKRQAGSAWTTPAVTRVWPRTSTCCMSGPSNYGCTPWMRRPCAACAPKASSRRWRSLKSRPRRHELRQVFLPGQRPVRRAGPGGSGRDGLPGEFATAWLVARAAPGR